MDCQRAVYMGPIQLGGELIYPTDEWQEILTLRHQHKLWP